MIIDENTGNGGFVTTTTGNITSLTGGGWTAANGVWVTTDSGLTSDPFGTQVLANSQAVQIHQGIGETLTSSAFALNSGETINFSIDWMVSGSGDLILSIDLVGTGAEGTINLASLNSSGGPASLTQADFNGAVVANTGTYELVMTLPALSPGRDVAVDRVYLESVSPPASGTVFFTK